MNCNLVLDKNISKSYALVHLTDKMREQIDSANFAFGIFVDLQKAYDTIDYDFLIKKLNHSGIRVGVNTLFSTYLQNQLQYIIINGFQFGIYSLWCPSKFYFRAIIIYDLHQ